MIEETLIEGQVYGIYKFSFNNNTFISRSYCDLSQRREWIEDVARRSDVKPIGAFIVRKVHQKSNAA